MDSPIVGAGAFGVSTTESYGYRIPSGWTVRRDGTFCYRHR